MATEYDVAHALTLVRNNLEDLGWSPRDADGNDYQRGSDDALRFKVGTAYHEVTVLVMHGNTQVDALRATSYAGLDRLILAIRRHIDMLPTPVTDGLLDKSIGSGA
jgi:hypothetical protein